MNIINQTPIDPRLKQLSYSSELLLESCPRKYELTKYGVADNAIPDMESELHKAFGKAVHLGVQLALEGKNEEEITWQVFLTWDTHLLNELEKKHKSFWLALLAIKKFTAIRAAGFLAGWKLATLDNGRPATELSFLIELNEGFNNRGFIDMLMEHEETGEILVLELKTDGSYVINDAKYANSPQTFGYSVLLDHLRPGHASYKVMYLIYSTYKQEYYDYLFNRTPLHKAEWIKTQLLTVEMIKMYHAYEHFPKHGQSCLAYNKPCRYYGICSLSNQTLVRPATKEQLEALAKDNEETYEYHFKLADLIGSQLAKQESNTAVR